MMKHLHLKIIFLFFHLILGDNENHNKAFGTGIRTNIDEHDGFMNPIEFIEIYFLKNMPIVFKQAARKWPALLRWSDDYFLALNLSGYNKTTVHVEMQKKENRSLGALNMEFKEFIRLYNNADIYLVDKLPIFLDSDVAVPWSLQCSLWDDSINQVLMWFSSGGTSSVVHTDDMDNINCLLSGEKTFVLVNPHLHKDKIPMNEKGAYSDIDVDKVDFNKYPGMASVDFQIADMVAGDCLYIPRLWIHQVRSFHRNIAINIWFTKTQSELSAFSHEDFERDCSPVSISKTFLGTNFVGLGDSEPNFLALMRRFGNLRAEDLLDSLLKAYPMIVQLSASLIHVKSVIKDIFLELDQNQNSFIDVDEINSAPKESFIRITNYLKYLKVYLESVMTIEGSAQIDGRGSEPLNIDLHTEL